MTGPPDFMTEAPDRAVFGAAHRGQAAGTPVAEAPGVKRAPKKARSAALDGYWTPVPTAGAAAEATPIWAWPCPAMRIAPPSPRRTMSGT